jgi:hypothetical protein
LSSVSVPVLSVQQTSIAPRFWMALSRFTTHLCLAIIHAPLARFAVTIIGSISGVRPTATAIPNRNASTQSPFSIPLTRKTTGTMTAMKRIRTQLTALTPRSKLVRLRRPSTLEAIDPK